MSMELATLRRSPDAQVAGVCAGLARRYDVDPTVVRVAMLLLALSGGVGLVLYGFAWALAPGEGRATSPFRAAFPSFPALSDRAWTALVVLACLAVGSALHNLLPFGILGGVAILWVARWWVRRSATADGRQAWPLLPEASADPSLALPATVAPGPGATSVAPPAFAASFGAGAPAASAGATAVGTRRRRGSARITWLVLGAALAAMIGDALWAEARGSAATLGTEPLAVATVVLGLGTLAAAIKGRPRVLATVALGAAVALGLTLAVPSIPAPTRHHVAAGDIVEHPSTVADLSDVSTSSGDVVADYSGLALGADTTTNVHTSLGDARVVLPRDANAVVIWQTKLGGYDGPDQHLKQARSGSYRHVVDPSKPTLTISVTTSLGDIQVVTP